MSSAQRPGDEQTPRAGGDTDRGNNPTEPIDPETVAEAAAEEPVLESEGFPSGGGDAGTVRGTITTGGAARGSTGRNATDAGKTDSEGVEGGGSAGAAGG